MREITITVRVPDTFDLDGIWEIQQEAQEYVNSAYSEEISEESD